MSTPSEAVLQDQLEAIIKNGLYTLLSDGAKTNRIPLSLVLAIGSRETNLVNELGDYDDDLAQGIGIMQADVQYPIAKQARDSGTWKTSPETLINFCCQLIAQNISWAQKNYPTLNDERALYKITAALYNAGPNNVTDGIDLGDCDRYTTGGDYGQDTITRMSIFGKLI